MSTDLECVIYCIYTLLKWNISADPQNSFKIWNKLSLTSIFYTIRSSVLFMFFHLCVGQDDAHIFCRESQVC